MNNRAPPHAIILRGLPGSGKTSLSEELHRQLAPSILVCVDSVRSFVLPRELTQSQLWAGEVGAAHLAIPYASLGMHVIIESCFEEAKNLAECAEILTENGFTTSIYSLYCPLEVCHGRNAQRTGLALVPPERLDALAQHFDGNRPPSPVLADRLDI